MMEVTKILLGIPIFSILSFIYSIIGIGTIGITANTHQALTVKAQKAKSLLQHRPIMVTSCPTDRLPCAMRIPVQG